MRRFVTTLAAGAAALTLIVSPLRADVLVVDAGGGGAFLTIEAAVDAAVDGDVIVVRPGDYTNLAENTEVHIDGKALSLVADGGPVISPPIQVANLPAGKNVVLRGLDARVNSPAGLIFLLELTSSLDVLDCDGQVWAEDCSFEGELGTGALGNTQPGFPGAHLLNAADVVLSRCQLVGGDGVDTGPHFFRTADGGNGLLAVDSSVQLYDCVITGGDGSDNQSTESDAPGYNGGHGVVLDGSTALLSATSIVGGPGGVGRLGHVDVKYTGGDGLHLSGSFSQARVLDSTITPGAGGIDAPSGLQGPDGVEVFIDTGVVVDLPGTARLLSVSSPFRENGNATLTYKGEPGDVIHLFGGFSTLSAPLYGNNGHWMVNVPWIEVLGLATVTDPGGVFELSFFIAPFPSPLFEDLEMWAQLFVQAPGGQVLVSSPASMTMLDENF